MMRLLRNQKSSHCLDSLDHFFYLLESRTNIEKKNSKHLIEREYRLERMQFLCQSFGSPQNDYKIIHIAGSKGKGSTAAYIAALLGDTGQRVGIYSSPHLVDYRERFRLLGNDFPEKQALSTAHQMLTQLPDVESQLTDSSPATTFELLTLFAFLLFRDLLCDSVVVECGLGGRLDATNVIEHPTAVVLTPIEMEHVEILGSTLRDIASEKSGIMKQGVPAFSAVQKSVVQNLFRERSQVLDVPLQEISRHLSRILADQPEGFRWVLEWQNGLSETIELRMGGKIQAENAALAIHIVRTIIPKLPQKALKALKKVQLPGRFQILRTKPLIVLDGAHTPNSIKSIADSFHSVLGDYGSAPPVLLFGCVVGKNYSQMAESLCRRSQGYFGTIIISTPGTFKSSEPHKVANSFKQFGARVELILNPEEAWQRCLEYAGKERGILVTGSFYMAGEIARFWQSGLS